MKKFKKLEGIVLLNICDEYLLVSTKEARGKVPHVLHINGASAYYWKMLEKNYSPKQMVRQACLRYHMEPQKAVQAVQLFFYQMNKRGYIEFIEIEDET